MRKIFFSLFIFPPVILSAQSDAKFTINGTLKNFKDTVQWVFLSYRLGPNYISDSILVQNNTYQLNGMISEPVKGTLIAQYRTTNKIESLSFIIEKGVIDITSIESFSNATINGGEANKEYIKLQKQMKPYTDSTDQLWRRFDEAEKNNDRAGMKKYQEAIKVMDSEMKEEVYRAYLIKNSGSPIALYILQAYAGYEIDPGKIESLYNQIAPSLCDCMPTKYFHERIQIAKQTVPGKMAMNFQQTDTSGNLVSLSSFRGKYLLLNFWASWCPHCAEENPHLVSIFNKYKDKGFTILSVSLDRPGEKENWLGAIRSNHLNWTHVSDLKEWDNKVAVQYGIIALPQNFLIDPGGKIIARNLLSENLDRKLEEIFKEKK